MQLYITLFLMGFGLAMDAFAVSICKGLSMKKVKWQHATIIGLFFGGFQALMPFVGWLLGSQFEQYITKVDHWIAFGLLGIIGGKMLYEAIKGDEEEGCSCCNDKNADKLDLKELFILAIATSIDALAVGITFAFLKYPVVKAVTVIGVVTFIISMAGVYIGNFFGSRFKKKAEIAGGIILVGIGIKILLEHLGIF
ncbi:MAG: manganese efflux pump MntP family protein [Lachnospiraceae bacterium]|nr:manganese efflux pump MntP family protein [Lachnospiraceae bacterium]